MKSKLDLELFGVTRENIKKFVEGIVKHDNNKLELKSPSSFGYKSNDLDSSRRIAHGDLEAWKEALKRWTFFTSNSFGYKENNEIVCKFIILCLKKDLDKFNRLLPKGYKFLRYSITNEQNNNNQLMIMLSPFADKPNLSKYIKNWIEIEKLKHWRIN